MTLLFLNSSLACAIGGMTPLRSGKQESSLRLGDGAPEFPGRFQPFSDYHLGVGERLLACSAICRAAGQLVGPKEMGSLQGEPA